MMGKEPYNEANQSEGKPSVVLSACGVASDVTAYRELIVENSVVLRSLTLSESVMWYGLLFDALPYDECVARYRRSEERLGETLDPPEDAVKSLLDDGLLCMGMEPTYDDALFSVFCDCLLSCAVEQNDCGEFFRRKGHWTMYDDRYLHWDGVEQSPLRTEPLSGDEHKIMAMLIAESWSMAELTRNLAKGYSTSVTRFTLPEEHYAILPLDPLDDVIRRNYERDPMARVAARAVLHLLRSRRVLLY